MESYLEQRYAIKFCFKSGKTATETYQMMQNAYGDDCLSRSNVFLWFGKFRDGREDTKDDERTGRPRTSRTDSNIEAVRAALKGDRRLTIRLLAEHLNIDKETVRTIIVEDLGKRKLCARFVPHSLTTEQKEERVAACQDLLQMQKSNPEFLNKIITGDESWCFAYDPETKRQSSEWVGPNSPKAKKLRFQKSRVKTMLVAFFDCRGMIHREFVPEGQTVNATFYMGVMNRLLKRIARVRPDMHANKSWFLLHDNAPSHNAAVIRQFLAKKNSYCATPPHVLAGLGTGRLLFVSKAETEAKRRAIRRYQDDPR